MVALGKRRDAWWDDGQGARRDRTKHRVVSVLALMTAIAACGLTTAAWLREVLPALTTPGLG
jgi:hypothetical protein